MFHFQIAFNVKFNFIKIKGLKRTLFSQVFLKLFPQVPLKKPVSNGFIFLNFFFLSFCFSSRAKNPLFAQFCSAVLNIFMVLPGTKCRTAYQALLATHRVVCLFKSAGPQIAPPAIEVTDPQARPCCVLGICGSNPSQRYNLWLIMSIATFGMQHNIYQIIKGLQ